MYGRRFVMSSPLDYVIDRYRLVLQNQSLPEPEQRFRSYAVGNFRGGIGKTTLAFNLAFQISRLSRLLAVDLCPQRNLSELLVGEALKDLHVTVYDALIALVSPGQPAPDAGEMHYRISKYNDTFKGGKSSAVIPGSAEMFLFPAALYSTLSQTASLTPERAKRGIKTILLSLRDCIAKEAASIGAEKIILDLSPFFGGGSHLGFIAADALVVPVRVDQQSVNSLGLLLQLLTDEKREYLRYNVAAGIDATPKIHAIVMTHCGWSRTKSETPDQSTRTFVSQVIELVAANKKLFSWKNPLDSIVMLDDFHSAGRISGAQRVPIAELRAGDKYTIDHQRLEVNPSVDRYKLSLASLAAML
jgi:chromosome partitioning protein